MKTLLHYATHFAALSKQMRIQDLPTVVRSADALRMIVWDLYTDSAGRDVRTIRDILEFETRASLNYFISNFNRHRDGWRRCGDATIKIECLRKIK